MQIQQKAELQRKAGMEMESTCQICLKTKFADGIGHICNYCNVRCCARCGGKVALRSSKVRNQGSILSTFYEQILRQQIYAELFTTFLDIFSAKIPIYYYY